MKRAALLVLHTVLLACAGATMTVPSGLRVTVTEQTYTLRDRMVRVSVSITNTTSAPIALASCAGVVTPLVEIEARGNWREHNIAGCVNVPFEPRNVAAGETIAAEAWATEPGRFRVRAPLFVDGQHLHFSRETSAVFEVRY